MIDLAIGLVISVAIVCDTYLFSKGYESFIFSRNTPEELEIQRLTLRKMQIEAGELLANEPNEPIANEPNEPIANEPDDFELVPAGALYRGPANQDWEYYGIVTEHCPLTDDELRAGVEVQYLFTRVKKERT